MKRKSKNIIMISLLIILCGSMIFTMNLAKDNTSSKIVEQPNMNNNDMKEPPEKSDGENTFQNNKDNTTLENSYIIAFVIESLMFSLLISYLAVSNFNKYTLKEICESKNKVIAYVIFNILLTGGLTFGNKVITEKYFLDSNNTSEKSPQQPGGGSNSNVSYNSAKEIKEDTTITEGTYESTTADENAISVSGDVEVSLSNITINKSGDSDGGDNTSFYGTNAGIIAKNGASLTIENATITTDAKGANGVFSYGGSATTNNSSSDGTTIAINNSIITTSKDGSGGIMTTGGGVMIANNLTINTSGTSSAAIRTDRGGGDVTVDGGTYTTTGVGSPAIYSTANVKVSNATLNSEASEGAIIEGKNSITLTNCTLTDNNTKLNGQSTTYKNVFLYQSMSGDAANGNAEFTAKDSKIITNKGDSFYVTNTTATINLTNNEIINNDSTGNFLRAQKDSWGNNGSNGGIVTLSMNNQTATGNIVIDSISTLNMTIKENSYYEGTINGDNSAKEINLIIDSSSKIKLTSDSYVTSLSNEDSTYGNIDFNGYKLYVNGKSIN